MRQTKHFDRFGRALKEGNTFRLYMSDEDFYGRPVIVGYKNKKFVANIPNYRDGIDLDFYFEDAKGSAWDTFEIVKDYPNAESY